MLKYKVSERRMKVEALRAKGLSYRQIAKELNVPLSSVIYHLRERVRVRSKARAIEYEKTHGVSEKIKQKRRNYLRSPAGRHSVARSWLRNYLKNKIITKEDVFDVLKEFD